MKLIDSCFLVCFLAQSALHPAFARRPATPAMDRPQLAILGLVHSHVWGPLATMAELREAEFVGVAEPNRELVVEAKKRAPNVDYFDDYRRMIETKKPDIVWAFVENNRHLEIVEYCAPRKINVIFEKPLAQSYADALKIRSIARRHGIQVMTNYYSAWWPANFAAKAEVDKGSIGPVWRLHGLVGHGGPGANGVKSKFFFQWLTDPVQNGAGSLVDFGCYNALWAMWYLGRPESVYATVNHLRPETYPRVEDNAVIVLSYRNAVGIFESSWDLPRSSDHLEVFGRSGSLLLDGDRVEIWKGKESTEVVVPPLPADRQEPISYIISRLSSGKPVDGLVALDINVAVTEIIEAAKESVKTGRAVKLPLSAH